MAEGHVWCLITLKLTHLCGNPKRCQYVQCMELCVVPRVAEIEHMWESLHYVNDPPPGSYMLYVTKVLILCASLPFEPLNSTFQGNGCLFNKASCFLPSIQVSLVLCCGAQEPRTSLEVTTKSHHPLALFP